MPPFAQRLAELVAQTERYLDALRDDGAAETSLADPRLLDPLPGAPPAPRRAPAPSAVPAPAPIAGPPPTPVPGDLAARCAALQAVARDAAACQACGLCQERRQAVPGQGNPAPELLFVGEAPGEDEDRQGEAFIGRAGQLLTRLITRMGYTRDAVFIANIVKCRPPGNRKPAPDEMAACFPFLRRQIAVLQPKVMVALGATALAALVSPDARISKTRGQWQVFEGIPLMPTYHPSYLLRNPSASWDVWNDMVRVLERLGRPVPPDPRRPS